MIILYSPQYAWPILNRAISDPFEFKAFRKIEISMVVLFLIGRVSNGIIEKIYASKYSMLKSGASLALVPYVIIMHYYYCSLYFL